jgi:large subunit ribosomal protein L11
LWKGSVPVITTKEFIVAKKLKAIVKLNLTAGKANPAPPVGPALASHGINIMAFCKEYNAKTTSKMGEILPAEITIYTDGSFTFILKTPPTAYLLKKAAGIETASATGSKAKVAKITKAQIREIAETKFKDTNAPTIESAIKQVEGTARNMGLQIVD